MGWMGKIIGGTLGLCLGGPLGFILGAAVGHLFDKTAELASDSGSGAPEPESQYYGDGNATENERRKMIYFVSVFSMLAKLSSADGPVNPQSKRRVERFIDDNMGSGSQGAVLARNIFEEALRSKYSFESFARQFHSCFGGDDNMVVTMMHILFEVSMADGSMTQAEESLIDQAGAIFRFSFLAMSALKMQYRWGGSQDYGGRRAAEERPADLSRSYAVLGVGEDASDEEVRKAYHKLSIEYHPDMVASKGLPEEFSKFATEKFKEINAAYQEIKKARGIK